MALVGLVDKIGRLSVWAELVEVGLNCSRLIVFVGIHVRGWLVAELMSDALSVFLSQ